MLISMVHGDITPLGKQGVHMPQIRYSVSQRLIITHGLVLQPGRYSGRANQPLVVTFDGIATRRRFVLELSASEV